MNKKLITLAVAGALATPMFAVAADAAPTPEHSFSYNVGVTSNYLFRGISQTHGNPAIQGGVDYAHSSGLYAGVWASNIEWVKNALGKGSTEVDFYGGFKKAFAEDWTYDIGLIHYNYMNKGRSTAFTGTTAVSPLNNPNTTEVYGAIGYKWITVKYSQAISKNFIGWVPTTTAGGNDYSRNTRGSNYLEINAAYDLGDGWGISGHIGSQKVKNLVATTVGPITDANYTDWNIGVTKDVGFGVVGLTYSDTDTNGTCNSNGGTNAYCWGKNMNTATGTNYKDASKGTAVLSFKKTF
jgi:uncharacterized protein (TIGR02001 family)